MELARHVRQAETSMLSNLDQVVHDNELGSPAGASSLGRVRPLNPPPFPPQLHLSATASHVLPRGLSAASQRRPQPEKLRQVGRVVNGASHY